MIESVARKKRFVVVFDEFQDILKINDADEAIALLRSKIHIVYIIQLEHTDPEQLAAVL